jgi:hypothetical protein
MADNFTDMKPLRHENIRINKLTPNSKTEIIFYVSLTRYSIKCSHTSPKASCKTFLSL